jgi:hypothetical protein
MSRSQSLSTRSVRVTLILGVVVGALLWGCAKKTTAPEIQKAAPETSRGAVPLAPTTLAATAASTTQINLTWTDASTNETGFKVERAPGGTTTFAEVATLTAGCASYQNTGLSAGTSYSYRVRAYNGAGSSGYSNTATTTTPGAGSVPAAPTGLTATGVSTTQIDLAWTDASNNETGFKVERAPGGTTTFAEIATLAAGSASYPNTGLSAGTSYSYRVRAYNGAGNSGYSNSATASSLSLVTVPAAPKGLKVTSHSTTTARLEWTDASDNENGFKLEQAPGGTTNFVEVATFPAGTWAYTTYGLSPATSYVFRVRAYNASGNSLYSNSAEVTTTTLNPVLSAPPAATGTFTVTIVYDWPLATFDSDHYELEESSTSPSSGFVAIHNSPNGLHESPYYVSPTRDAGTYYYRARVRIFNTFTGYSNVVKVVVTAQTAVLNVVNSSSYPIISVAVDNSSLLACPMALLPGASGQANVTTGSHAVRIVNGSCDGSTSDEMYVTQFNYSQPAGTSTYTLYDPTINQLLTRFGSSASWAGDYWDANASPHWMKFVFTSGGTWTLYNDGVQIGTGTYSLVSRTPSLYTVDFRVTTGSSSATGTLYEREGYFMLQNGPASWPWIQYNYQGY